MDKAGYGYLLRQNQNWGNAFASGDTYNWFPFGAAQALCPDLPNPIAANCHRIASMAFFKPASGAPYLYFFPWRERLSAFAFSNNSAQTPPGSPTPTVTTSGTTVNGTNTLFTEWLVPGDKITFNTSPNPTTLTVKAINADDGADAVDVYETSNIGTATTFTYSGYFINPLYDLNPSPASVGYPGGQLAVTSNGGDSSSEIIWA